MFKKIRLTLKRKLIYATGLSVAMFIAQGYVSAHMSSGSAELAKQLSENVTPTIAEFADFKEQFFTLAAKLEAYRQSYANVDRTEEIQELQGLMQSIGMLADSIRPRMNADREFFGEPASIIDVAHPIFLDAFAQNGVVIAGHLQVLDNRKNYQGISATLTNEINEIFLRLYELLETTNADGRQEAIELLGLGDIANYNLFMANNRYNDLLITDNISMQTVVLDYLSKSQEAFETMSTFTRFNSVSTRIATARSLMAELEESFASGMVYFQQYDEDVALQLKYEAGLAEQLYKLSDVFSEMSAAIGNDTYEASRAMLKASFIMIILALMLAVVVIIVLLKTVVAPLTRFTEMTKELTEGDGDLTKRIETNSNDELKDLADYFNAFIASVQNVIVEVKAAADEVVSGNSELAATMEELATTFEIQTREVSEIVVNMDSINQTATSANEALTRNLDILSKTSDSTKDGQAQLSEVQDKMSLISEQANSLSETITKLSTSSGHIGEILTTINDIADQTNLLALNAAIEAARAGDAGRGFAVVADEVRKLAERTQKATSEIESIILTLQSDSEDASNEMIKSGEFVSEGVQSIHTTSAGFDNVVETVTSILSDTEQLASLNTEQFHTIKTVSDNTQTIAAGIEQSNMSVSQVVETVTHLQNRTENLKQLISMFKA